MSTTPPPIPNIKIPKDKKSKVLMPLKTKVKVKDNASEVRLLPSLQKDYLEPRKCKQMEGEVVGYLDIAGRSELYPIVEFQNGKSIFFEINLEVVGYLPKHKENPPIVIFQSQKLPELPDFLKNK
jgi:hypothetical protein